MNRTTPVPGEWRTQVTLWQGRGADCPGEQSALGPAPPPPTPTTFNLRIPGKSSITLSFSFLLCVVRKMPLLPLSLWWSTLPGP